MVFLKDQDRVETDRFQTGRIEKREIETGAHLLLHDRITEADTLADRFKACRRDGINDILFLNGRKNGSCLQNDSVRVI